MQENKDTAKEKILFMLLPFWTPLIPPLGISCLKSYLGKRGYCSKTVDANVELEFMEVYKNYFDILRSYIPLEKRGNFNNSGNYVLSNHLMSYFNRDENSEYLELIKIVIAKYYYTDVDNSQINKLDEIVADYYSRLEEYICNWLKEEKPTVLGLSVYSGTLASSLFTFKTAKRLFPEIQTVMGGGIFADQLSQGSPNLEYFINNTPYIDKIMVGEGEILFTKYLEGSLGQDKKMYSLLDLGEETLDLSRVEVPDFSDLKLDSYPQITAYASRSCPFQCSFCSETVQWGKYRKKDANQIVDETLMLYKKHGSQLFLFGDSLLNPVIEDLADEYIRRGESIYWDGYLRADKHVCDPENTFKWRRGGFYRARIGVESGSQRVLNLMDKRTKIEQIKEAISSLAYAGIKTTTYWVIGFPGETEEDFMETLNLIEELADNIYEAECNPYNYFISGQVDSNKLKNENEISLLYPQYAEKLLMGNTWMLNAEPTRQVTYERISRFVAHCKRLGVYNPYSVYEIQNADERWIRLHQNAVPAMMEFRKEGKFINENLSVKKTLIAEVVQQDNIDFTF
ncbi:B12-binding domain-containing radical SAM protein [Acetivibrio cellulolyticus]|uniref:B12-binding domain-containing radical SAM protein n=1 Tax=Acetivibrio cellulolyticus TaxID=35830 RepID=UPI0001E2F598|nr:radical SAM protein [Acetivibrio cellulolyticus]